MEKKKIMRRPRNYDVLNLSNLVTAKELLRIILDYSHERFDFTTQRREAFAL